jgi:hypothetical protein
MRLCRHGSVAVDRTTGVVADAAAAGERGVGAAVAAALECDGTDVERIDSRRSSARSTGALALARVSQIRSTLTPTSFEPTTVSLLKIRFVTNLFTQWKNPYCSAFSVFDSFDFERFARARAILKSICWLIFSHSMRYTPTNRQYDNIFSDLSYRVPLRGWLLVILLFSTASFMWVVGWLFCKADMSVVSFVFDGTHFVVVAMTKYSPNVDRVAGSHLNVVSNLIAGNVNCDGATPQFFAVCMEAIRHVRQ